MALMQAQGQGVIGRRLFEFLRGLREHNTREWFEAHRERYEADVREPLVQLVVEFGPRLAAISEQFVADPRPNGGSIFRIYRDTRFSKDKTPYKTNAGVHFRHSAGKDVHAPGFYLHLEPGEVFAGFGIWHPDAPAQGRIRDAIVARPEAWRGAVAAASSHGLTLGGEQLSRPPRGYDPEHPLIDDLRRKDYVLGADFSEAEACAPGFLDRFDATARGAAPFTRFLTEAVGLPW